MLSCITLRCNTQIVLPTYNGLPFFPASSLFHDQLRFKAFSLVFLPHPFSFCFPLPLFHLSLLLMLCHCANEEEQKEKGGMNLGHRRPCISSLHSATIKRKLICGSPAFPFPLASSPDGDTHAHTCPHTAESVHGNSVHPPLGSIILFPKQQVHLHWEHTNAAWYRHTGSLPCAPSPTTCAHEFMFDCVILFLNSKPCRGMKAIYDKPQLTS